MSDMISSREIEARLEAVRASIRRSQKSRAAFVIATVALGGLLVVMAVDLLFAPLPGWARWVLFLLWLAALAAAAQRTLAPLFREISLLRIARWLEIRHPEMQERLSTVLELSTTRGGVSPDLLESLARAAGQDIRGVDPQGEVQAARRRRLWRIPAIASCILLLLVLAVWPREASRLLLRALAPFADLGNAGATRFTIRPGNVELLEGDRLEITFSYSGPEFNEVQTTQATIKEHESYSYVLDPVRESLRYRVQAGRAQSDTFTATVSPAPAIAEPRATLVFPPYTGLANSTIDPAGGIKAVAGTRVSLTGKTNTAIEAACLEIDGKRMADARVQSTAGGTLSLDWTLTPESAGQAMVMLQHRLRPRCEALRFEIDVLPDMAPEVALIKPDQRELSVRPHEKIVMQYAVTEDFGVAHAAIEAEAAGQRAAFDQPLPGRAAGGHGNRFHGSAAMAVGLLRERFPGAREFRLRVAVTDSRTDEFGGPGIGHSGWLTLKIDDHVESLARREIRAQQEEARRGIEQALRAAREAKSEIARNEQELQKQEPAKAAAQQLAKTAEKLAAAEEQSARLAEQLEAGIHAAKADEVQDAAEAFAEARENLENSQLQESSAERANQLVAAEQELDQAIAMLESAREQIASDQRKAEDLAQALELAARQEELARQAQAKAAANPQAGNPDKAWQDEQQRVANALHEEAKQAAAAEAAALENQAGQLRDLAEQAAEHAAAQNQLAEQSRQFAKADPQSLPTNTPEALANEQQTQAQAAAELAEALAGMPAQNPALEQAAATAAEAAQAAQAASQHSAKTDQPAAENHAANPAESSSGQPLPQPTPASEMAAAQAAAQAASPMNASAAAAMQQTASALGELASQMEQAAVQSAQSPEADQAPLPAARMAEAAQAATQAAASPQLPEAARQAAAAAQALTAASAAAMRQMQGAQAAQSPQAAAPSAAPAPPGGQPGSNPMAGDRQPEPDPGVPPELSKLGISAADWEKIKATLGSDVGAPGPEGIPAEYRPLVKDYFENLSRSK